MSSPANPIPHSAVPARRRPLERAWDAFVGAWAVAAAVLIPLSLVREVDPHVPPALLEAALTVVFGADVAVRLVRRRRARAQLPLARRQARHGLLALDALAALPVAAVLGFGPAQLLRMAKLARVESFLTRGDPRVPAYASALRLGVFAFWLLLALHWIACGWAAIGGATPPGGGSRYVGALYWAVTTLATVGYGDVAPRTDLQRLYAMGVMVVGVGVYGYVIGNVASILSKVDPLRAQYLQRQELLHAFMRYRNLPSGLQRRLNDHFEYLWERHLVFDESAVLAGLPPSLRLEVTLHLKRDVLENVPLFRGGSEAFLRDIALALEPSVFLPGEWVFRAGEPARDMFFISRGKVEVVGDGGAVFATLGDGDFFGEIALFLNRDRSASVRALDYCNLYRLDRAAFERILGRHPAIAEQMQALARERSARQAGGGGVAEVAPRG